MAEWYFIVYMYRICDNMGGSGEYHVKWNIRKIEESYDFTHMLDVKMRATSEQEN